MPCMALHGRFGCVDPCFEAGVRGRMWLPGDWMTLCPALGLQILRFAQNADYPHTVDLVGINAAEYEIRARGCASAKLAPSTLPPPPGRRLPLGGYEGRSAEPRIPGNRKDSLMGCLLNFRAEYEIRTRDPQLGKLMLYQLS